jgi:hypothetical protein
MLKNLACTGNAAFAGEFTVPTLEQSNFFLFFGYKLQTAILLAPFLFFFGILCPDFYQTSLASSIKSELLNLFMTTLLRNC